MSVNDALIGLAVLADERLEDRDRARDVAVILEQHLAELLDRLRTHHEECANPACHARNLYRRLQAESLVAWER